MSDPRDSSLCLLFKNLLLFNDGNSVWISVKDGSPLTKEQAMIAYCLFDASHMKGRYTFATGTREELGKMDAIIKIVTG